MPKVGAELILEIFWFGKLSAATRYHLLILDHGYRTVNGIVQLFLLIFLNFYFLFFSSRSRDELGANRYRIGTYTDNTGYRTGIRR
ncbi:hypothetical protein Hanom_Chr04g00299671 [Helianthus anomalus]